ncbi:hypothetical protein Tco_1016583 [Tanacetum coccineum]|uniref:Uncharacterized protein n=1 Tax=Tanacetum coccineum TaxID=301880 RepID=A0ABQ5FQB6_9ASTR
MYATGVLAPVLCVTEIFPRSVEFPLVPILAKSLRKVVTSFCVKSDGELTVELEPRLENKGGLLHTQMGIVSPNRSIHSIRVYFTKNLPEAADNSGPIFDTKPLKKVHTSDDHYNVFATERQHPKQPESINDTYVMKQDDRNINLDSSHMCSDEGEAGQDDELEQERVLLDSLLEKLKSEINDSKNRNKSLETSNKAFQKTNKELAEVNTALVKDLDKYQFELDSFKNMKCVKDAENDYAEAYEMEKELSANQKIISTILYEKEEQERFYKTREENKIEKVLSLEKQVKVLNDIVYKTRQSVQTMNMLNRNVKMSFAKPQYLKKEQSQIPCLFDIGCYTDNLVKMLAPESDKTIHLDRESRSKLSDLIKPFDYTNLNNLYEMFVPQRNKSAEQKKFSNNSGMSYTSTKNAYSKEMKNVIEQKISPTVDDLATDVDEFFRFLKEEMVEDLK